MLCLIPFSHVSGLCPIRACRRVVILYLGWSSIDPNEQIFRPDCWCRHFPRLVCFIHCDKLLTNDLWWFCLSYISVRLIGDVLLSWESFGDGGFCKRFVDCFGMCFVVAEKGGHRLFFPKTTSHNYVNIKIKNEWLGIILSDRNEGKGEGMEKMILSDCGFAKNMLNILSYADNRLYWMIRN